MEKKPKDRFDFAFICIVAFGLFLMLLLQGCQMVKGAVGDARWCLGKLDDAIVVPADTVEKYEHE